MLFLAAVIRHKQQTHEWDSVCEAVHAVGSEIYCFHSIILYTIYMDNTLLLQISAKAHRGRGEAD